MTIDNDEHRPMRKQLSEEDSMYLKCYRDLLFRHATSHSERELVANSFDQLLTEGAGGLEQEILAAIKNRPTPLHTPYHGLLCL